MILSILTNRLSGHNSKGLSISGFRLITIGTVMLNRLVSSSWICLNRSGGNIVAENGMILFFCWVRLWMLCSLCYGDQHQLCHSSSIDPGTIYRG